MPIYFTSDTVQPPATIYMGVDKHENEDLIKWGWPEDVWFHVDKLSSAHVYLRLRPGETLDDIPSALLEDCAQLVKANSIQGNKMNNIKVVYTMWANLKKTGDMDVGQVGFFRSNEVRIISVEKRMNEIVNRLNKTKEERSVDLRAEREGRDKKEIQERKQQQREQRKLEEAENSKKEEESRVWSYDRIFTAESMEAQSNKNSKGDGNDSDDFM